MIRSRLGWMGCAAWCMAPWAAGCSDTTPAAADGGLPACEQVEVFADVETTLGPNLLVNGDFEAAGAGVPEGWEAVPDMPSAEVGADGCDAGECLVFEPDGAGELGVMQEVPLEPGARYAMSGRAVRLGTIGSVVAELVFLREGPSGQYISWRTLLVAEREQDVWERAVDAFVVPSDATTSILVVRANTPARADDFVIAEDLGSPGALLTVRLDCPERPFNLRLFGVNGSVPEEVAAIPGAIDLAERILAPLGLSGFRVHGEVGPDQDMSYIFPDPAADPSDPDAYDFSAADPAMLLADGLGAEILWVFGGRWERGTPTHNVPHAPDDVFAAAAVGLVRHYLDGWAEGYGLNVRYWEPWNEPNAPFYWGLGAAEYFSFHETVTRGLKAYDATLLVGGPSLNWPEYRQNPQWLEDFLAYVRDEAVPLDFFSYHIYHGGNPFQLVAVEERMRRTLERYGFGGVETVLNEWNLSQRESELLTIGPLPEMQSAYNGAHMVAVMIYLMDSSLGALHRFRINGREWGLFNGDGTPFPAAWAWQALRRVPEVGERVLVGGSDQRGFAALAAASSDGGTIRIAIADTASSRPAVEVQILGLPPTGGIEATHLLVDEMHDLVAVDDVELLGPDRLRIPHASPAVHLIEIHIR